MNIKILFFALIFANIACNNPIPAQNTMEGNFYIYATDNFFLMTESVTEDGTTGLSVENKQSQSSDLQVWTVKKAKDGFTIFNTKSGRALDVEGSSNDDDASVGTYEKTGNKNQTFALEKVGNAYLLKALHSNKYVAVYDYNRKTGSRIVQRTMEVSPSIYWRFVPATAKQIPFDKAALTAKPSQLDNATKTYTINPLPSGVAEAVRMGRNAPADYTAAGIYVKKGETITLTASGVTDANEDFLVLVGEPNAYWNAKPKTDPFQSVVKNGTNSFTSSRNGLLYFRYNNHPFQTLANGAVKIQITAGGSPSPLFVFNQTADKIWQNQLQNTTSPFVQFISDKAMITVSRKAFDKNSSMNATKTFGVLHQVVDFSNQLSGFDNSTFLNQTTPLRVHYVEDAISTGKDIENVYMYAGDQFIGMKPESVEDLLQADLLQKKWAIWHETGHTFQMNDWTWSEMGEVTVNLFSLNVQQQFGNPSRIYEEEEGEKISVLAKNYLDSDNKTFTVGENYTMNFVCMVMFEQLRKQYSNKFYAKLNQYYRQNPLNLEDVANENTVKQGFIYNVSKMSGNDLRDFFKNWGFTIDDDTNGNIKKLKLPKPANDVTKLFLE